jgi:nitrite reductase/ring-hydroxylating ferredoxin subunit
MSKVSTAASAVPISQLERIERADALRGELAKLEAQMRSVQEEIGALLARCEHTDADGRSSIVGGSTKVCSHCGKTVSRRGEKLWQ